MNIIKINIWNKNELNKKLREVNKEEIDKAVKNFVPIFQISSKISQHAYVF